MVPSRLKSKSTPPVAVYCTLGGGTKSAFERPVASTVFAGHLHGFWESRSIGKPAAPSENDVPTGTAYAKITDVPLGRAKPSAGPGVQRPAATVGSPSPKPYVIPPANPLHALLSALRLTGRAAGISV